MTMCSTTCKLLTCPRIDNHWLCLHHSLFSLQSLLSLLPPWLDPWSWSLILPLMTCCPFICIICKQPSALPIFSLGCVKYQGGIRSVESFWVLCMWENFVKDEGRHADGRHAKGREGRWKRGERFGFIWVPMIYENMHVCNLWYLQVSCTNILSDGLIHYGTYKINKSYGYQQTKCQYFFIVWVDNDQSTERPIFDHNPHYLSQSKYLIVSIQSKSCPHCSFVCIF